ncbi:MAG TPA: hypothetical protein VN903_17565 [Polyangia bacterium]|jgi:hypothetical protein|nr:hypothetical protein [Polyangia bacterium]
MLHILFGLLLAKAGAPATSTPASLPICAKKKDPLSALCALGADASKARFDCVQPQILTICQPRNTLTWACIYAVPFGEKLPSVTYQATFDHDGPPIKDGDKIDSTAHKRIGKVRGVDVRISIASDAEGKRRAAEISSQFLAWGCAAGETYRDTSRFQCGAWDARVSYNDIIRAVTVSAAETGKLDCQ